MHFGTKGTPSPWQHLHSATILIPREVFWISPPSTDAVRYAFYADPSQAMSFDERSQERDLKDSLMKTNMLGRKALWHKRYSFPTAATSFHCDPCPQGGLLDFASIDRCHPLRFLR
ncbi:uncharacterized protein LOC135055968 isoform X2 [Pseudophryne corroboree]|uniref:uncharacterized protein LOC135055968 isoform X2 n=1 Tax=Pseudophryne corroboree TaxID=495146 RepID=UPI00308202B4